MDTYIITHLGNLIIVSELVLGTEEVQGAIAMAEVNRSSGERLQILLNEPELVAVPEEDVLALLVAGERAADLRH